jgi:hypothetical protein
MKPLAPGERPGFDSRLVASFGGMAQLEAHLPCKQVAPGSSPGSFTDSGSLPERCIGQSSEGTGGHLNPGTRETRVWGNGAIGSALALQAGGSGFESRFLHKIPREARVPAILQVTPGVCVLR